MSAFAFAEFPTFSNGVIDVRVAKQQAADPARGWVPAYVFDILLAGTDSRVGSINLRVGDTPHLVKYGGHIGYGVDEAHRGHRYASQACRLIEPVARHHGMQTLWITVTPENLASRRTCELLGCEMVEIVELPEDTDMYQSGERRKCRYRWDLG